MTPPTAHDQSTPAVSDSDSRRLRDVFHGVEEITIPTYPKQPRYAREWVRPILGSSMPSCSRSWF